MKQISTLVLALFLLVVLAACQKQKETPKADESSKNVIAKEEKPNFEIIDPWIRPGSARTNTAFFFKIVNNTDKNDTLIDASSDLARKVQVHETYKAENDMMGMRHIEFVPVPAGDTVTFKPRSLHVMVMGLYNDLMIGDSGKVILTLKNAGDLSVTGVVRDMPKSMN
jgi:copper(I)-binding protein